MVICPQCSIPHGEGDEYCEKCGSFLLAIEDPPSEEERANVKLYCPKCQVLYKKGNYCMKCGSLLMRGTPSKEAGAQRLEKKATKRLSKEWLRLFKEQKALESRMRKLETQREKISVDVLDPLFIRYKERLESLSPLYQEVETELKSIRKRASGEMASLEDELKPIQKRLGEFQSLYKSGAVTKPDFVREKKGLKKEIKLREKSLKKYRQILSLLPAKMGGHTVSAGLAGDLLRPIPLIIVGIIIPLMIAGGYYLWPQHTESGTLVLKEVVVFPSTPSSSNHQPAVMKDNESEKIGSLFENIRQANLQKDIDLFMSCFSSDFNGTETKRLNTLKMWENYNYLDLSYDLKKQTISGDTADVRLEWLVRTSQKMSGRQKNGRTVLDVTLKREDGRWKIVDIKPVS
jgi:ketosteroid isomerase-like protein